MRVGIIGGSIAGCAAAALLHRASHDVTVFERSESELMSRGAGILSGTAAWQGTTAHGLFDESLPACRADYSRLVTRAPVWFQGVRPQGGTSDSQPRHRTLEARTAWEGIGDGPGVQAVRL
jgi:2-polyprenyl-6-methoxyphenol hydroxylase-like FAD-dependent oxidoreductase